MEPADPMPVRPVISCQDCKGLTYYGPQMAPAPDPRVQMAQIVTKGITGVFGIAAGAYAATDIASTIAGAGKMVLGPSSTNTTTTTSTTSTVEAVRPEVVETDKVVPVEPLVVRPEIVKPEILQN